MGAVTPLIRYLLPPSLTTVTTYVFSAVVTDPAVAVAETEERNSVLSLAVVTVPTCPVALTLAICMPITGWNPFTCAVALTLDQRRNVTQDTNQSIRALSCLSVNQVSAIVAT